MSNVNAAIVTEQAVTLVIDGQTSAITDSHPNYEKIRELAAAGTYAGIASLLDIPATINDFGEGKVTVVNGEVLYEGTATHNAVTDRILAMVSEGLTVAPLLSFLENLMENPSNRSVTQLYEFLEASDLPITEDGHFLAYRMCSSDWKDMHSHTFDNSVGAVVSMPRNQVDEDPDRTCSNGLHVCSQGYLGSYSSGHRTLLVKVNPAHVVAVPKDYNNAKMRVCEFTVMREIDPKKRDEYTKQTVYTETETDGTDLATLDNRDGLMTKKEARKYLGISKGALRKRLKRGKTVKSEYVDGEEMVRIVPTDGIKDANVMTDAEAIDYFGLEHTTNSKASLRKRLNRRTSCKRVMVDGEPMVKIIKD